MKKIILLTLFLVFCVESAKAQKTDKSLKVEQKIEEMTSKLGLDENQQATLLKLETEQWAKQKELRKKWKTKGDLSAADKVAKRKEVQELRKDYRVQFKEILTSEQFEKLQGEKLPKTKAKSATKQKAERMNSKFGLDASQQETVQQLETEQAAKMKELRKKFKAMETNGSLSDENKAAQRKELQQLRQEHGVKMKEIIRPEQIENAKNKAAQNAKESRAKSAELEIKQKVESMSKGLGLDKGQTASVLKAEKEQAEAKQGLKKKYKALRKDGKLSEEDNVAYKAEKKEARKAYKAEIKKILTPEQFEKFKAVTGRKEAREKKRRERE